MRKSADFKQLARGFLALGETDTALPLEPKEPQLVVDRGTGGGVRNLHCCGCKKGRNIKNWFQGKTESEGKTKKRRGGSNGGGMDKRICDSLANLISKSRSNPGQHNRVGVAKPIRRLRKENAGSKGSTWTKTSRLIIKAGTSDSSPLSSKPARRRKLCKKKGAGVWVTQGY